MATKEKEKKPSLVFATLEKIRRRHLGILQPAHVVEAAEDEASPLHPLFEWDNSKASHEYRLWQARHLIRATVVTVGKNGGSITINAYVSMMGDRTNEDGGYRALVDVMSSADTRSLLLNQALAELKVWEARYQQLLELAPIFAAAEKARKRQKRAPLTKKRKAQA